MRLTLREPIPGQLCMNRILSWMRKFPLIALRTLQRYEGDPPIGNNPPPRGEPNEPEISSIRGDKANE